MAGEILLRSEEKLGLESAVCHWYVSVTPCDLVLGAFANGSPSYDCWPGHCMYKPQSQSRIRKIREVSTGAG